MLRSYPFIKPCIPIAGSSPPRGDGWIHEVKFDGWRGQLHKSAGAVRLYSKRGNDLTFRFPELTRSIATLPLDNVVIDGEITALNGAGLPDFHGLQRGAPATFWCFDLLRTAADDLRELPLAERRAMLRDLVGEENVLVRFSENFNDAQALLSASDRMGLEGIVSKRCDGKYRSGRSSGWVKVKADAWREANRERWKLFEGRT